jgi:hypothetical protein
MTFSLLLKNEEFRNYSSKLQLPLFENSEKRRSPIKKIRLFSSKKVHIVG